MNRWNSLTGAQKGLAAGVSAIVLLGLVALGAYAMGVRCGAEGNYFTCSREEAPVEPLQGAPEGTETESETTPLSENDDRPAPIPVEGDAVVVNDQPAGPIVEVTMLTLTSPAWVAVYEDDNGAPGRVLGAARFEEGIHLGEISLLRSTSPARTYYLILHADTASRDFDLKRNALLTTPEGLSIRSSFRTFAE